MDVAIRRERGAHDELGRGAARDAHVECGGEWDFPMPSDLKLGAER
jgi:hypothetical protein